MSLEWKTVVWERYNSRGHWIPYSAEVCQLLEQAFSKTLVSVCLGDADVELKKYVVHLKEFVQVSEETGTKSEVRRKLCNSQTALAKGVLWQWLAEMNVWNNYSSDIINVIEEAFNEETEKLDLSIIFPRYGYEINFKKMMQKNKRSHYYRAIRRLEDVRYPVFKTPSSDSQDVIDVENIDPAPVASSSSSGEEPSVKTKKKKKLKNYMVNIWNSLKKNGHPNSDDSNDTSLTRTQQASVNLAPGFQDSNSAVSSDVMDKKYATVNGKPWTQIWPPHTPESQLKPVPGIDPLPNAQKKRGRKRSRSKKGVAEATSPTEPDVLNEFTEITQLPEAENSEEQVCTICYESMTKPSYYDDDSTLVKLRICSHIFHRSCILAMYDSGPKDNHLQCPTCKTIHGVKCGIQPPGTMDYHVLPYSLPGYPECDTIRIIYHISQGIQGPEHPNPGRHYTARGFPRYCYLPDNEMGRKILRLLITAWERRLIFTIGNSATTGEHDTVTWNEIHHKTEFGFNRYGHGYPDPNYFDNVLAELSAQGVNESTYAWFPA